MVHIHNLSHTIEVVQDTAGKICTTGQTHDLMNEMYCVFSDMILHGEQDTATRPFSKLGRCVECPGRMCTTYRSLESVTTV